MNLRFLVAGTSVALLALSACGSSNDGDLFTGAGGSAAAAGAGGTSSGGTSSGGTSGGGTSGGGTSGGGTSGGGSPSGGTSSGGAPGGGGAPDGGGAPGGGAPGGGAPGGGAPGGGGSPGGGGGGTGGAVGSCVGHCGSQNAQPPSNCYCDTICASQGDCCPDYATACGTSQVACDGKLCNLSAQYCCQQYSSGSWNGVCWNNGTQCNGAAMQCDGPEDCEGGRICCGTIATNGSWYVQLRCDFPVNCTGTKKRVVCGAQPGVCPPSTSCKPTGSPQGYSTCQP